MRLLSVLVASAALLACFDAQKHTQAKEAGSKEADNSTVSMSTEHARSLIAIQKGLDTIPKLVWKQLLTPDEYRILWKKGTERPFTGAYVDNKVEGVYVTKGCKIPVFHSRHKFKSGTGWPSYWDAVDLNNIVLKSDISWGMKRTEVLSACGEHLGHVFEDGPEPTGLRYCINSLALEFIPSQ